MLLVREKSLDCHQNQGKSLTNKFCLKIMFLSKKFTMCVEKSTMCVGKFHCECLSIPVEKIQYIDVVVLRHASYIAGRFDNPINSVPGRGGRPAFPLCFCACEHEANKEHGNVKKNKYEKIESDELKRKKARIRALFSL
jgi:hypothetical protein